jgi:hypothetical protein
MEKAAVSKDDGLNNVVMCKCGHNAEQSHDWTFQDSTRSDVCSRT